MKTAAIKNGPDSKKIREIIGKGAELFEIIDENRGRSDISLFIRSAIANSRIPDTLMISGTSEDEEYSFTGFYNERTKTGSLVFKENQS